MATPQEKKEAISGLTREDLLAIIDAVRKPVKTEKEIREEKQLEADRERMAETLKQTEANKQHKMKTCSHKRNNGTTTAVFIADFNWLYCQACTKWIKPTEEPQLFNEIYQLAV